MLTEARKRSNKRYAKAKIKRIPLDVQKSFYNDTLLPAVNASGKSINGYIKEAIMEKIERERNEFCS